MIFLVALVYILPILVIATIAYFVLCKIYAKSYKKYQEEQKTLLLRKRLEEEFPIITEPSTVISEEEQIELAIQELKEDT
jgi:hypothetical protein